MISYSTPHDDPCGPASWASEYAPRLWTPGPGVASIGADMTGWEVPVRFPPIPLRRVRKAAGPAGAASACAAPAGGQALGLSSAGVEVRLR